eukprot:CAMPEP_0170446074 /NCGR_PEP_ID=MMETSP0117_2-20130122/49409_1 /TAXON_ID=400756 /ORGANISM="Durinskia baltica, Strain CSIRO CS-38" /LENGTH=127 /DNA_ID=CAMNT_0010707009 /DNA_START=114 /DNA_END=497 /DNA_ORIENTATION=+
MSLRTPSAPTLVAGAHPMCTEGIGPQALRKCLAGMEGVQALLARAAQSCCSCACVQMAGPPRTGARWRYAVGSWQIDLRGGGLVGLRVVAPGDMPRVRQRTTAPTATAVGAFRFCNIVKAAILTEAG